MENEKIIVRSTISVGFTDTNTRVSYNWNPNTTKRFEIERIADWIHNTNGVKKIFDKGYLVLETEPRHLEALQDAGIDEYAEIKIFNFEELMALNEAEFTKTFPTLTRGNQEVFFNECKNRNTYTSFQIKVFREVLGFDIVSHATIAKESPLQEMDKE